MASPAYPDVEGTASQLKPFSKLARLRAVRGAKPPAIKTVDRRHLEREFRSQFQSSSRSTSARAHLLRIGTDPTTAEVGIPRAGYSPGTHTVWLASGLSEEAQRRQISHELAHAVQRSYGLTQDFYDRQYGSDELLARVALVEGDAMAMYWAIAKPAWGGPWHSRAFLRQEEEWRERPGAASFYGRLRRFPYSGGLRFVADLYRTGGVANIKKAFRDPPRSTEQVMFPARYRTKDEPSVVLPKGRVHDDSVLGSFGIYSWLMHHGASEKDALAVADGWGGDLFRAISGRGEAAPCGIWYTVWDTTLDAGEFYNQVTEVAKSQYCEADVDELSAQLSCRGADIHVFVRRQAKVIVILFGFEPRHGPSVASSVLARWRSAKQ